MQCDASTCGSSAGTPYGAPITFDLQVSGGNADGSVLLNEGGTPVTIHLTRQ